MVIEMFCPIVLRNFLFKIITKIIGDCLVEVVNHIVSDNQFGITTILKSARLFILMVLWVAIWLIFWGKIGGPFFSL